MSDALLVHRHIQAKQMRASGMKLREIAKIMGVATGTVASHLHYDRELAATRRLCEGQSLIQVFVPGGLRQIAKDNMISETAIAQRLLNLLANEQTLVENLLSEEA